MRLRSTVALPIFDSYHVQLLCYFQSLYDLRWPQMRSLRAPHFTTPFRLQAHVLQSAIKVEPLQPI